MPNTAKPDMSCARVKQYKSSNIGPAERHNERKNDSYDNVNVVPERIPMNVHFRFPPSSYMDTLRAMEADGRVSMRGLRQDATLFDEIVIDVNTMYFERNGGYEYAKSFYEEAYHFLEEKFGSEYVISAVMHADEINKAATDELGKEVYHYHLHAVVIPVVEKEILWSKRCKDKALVGTVKEVIRQISHSKKWKSDVTLTDKNGEVVLRKNGKPKYRASYSVLQDELFQHMTEHGYKGFQRGEVGSTRENLTSLQYQIEKDKERLADIEQRIEAEQTQYEPAHEVHKTVAEIENMGQKTLTGKIAMSKDDYSKLTALAKEGVTSRAEIQRLDNSVSSLQRQVWNERSAYNRLEERYNQLKEKCKPFLQAMEHFPELVKLFVDKVKELFAFKEAQERKEHTKVRRHKDDWER
jgi:CII-binding regulator of phage lambda lysogenization HflD